jgi:hypothetical protein
MRKENLLCTENMYILELLFNIVTARTEFISIYVSSFGIAAAPDGWQQCLGHVSADIPNIHAIWTTIC